MIYDEERDVFVFSTGVVKPCMGAGRAVIGLSETGEVSEGYDGVMSLYYSTDHDGQRWLTPDELRELADFMIARWQHFRDHVEERLAEAKEGQWW